MKSNTFNKIFSISTMISIIIFACFCLNTVSLMAAPYSGDVFSFLQPNGSRIEVAVWGDEFYHRIESIDGYTLTKDEKTGWICYATLSADNSGFVSTGIPYRGNDAPKGFEKHMELPPDIILTKVKEKQQELNKGIDHHILLDSYNKDLLSAPLSGPVLGLTLLIDFPDVASSISKTEIQNYLNQQGYSGYGCNGSVMDYFFDVSNEQLVYTNHVTEFYTAIHEKSYYTDPTISYGQRARELILEALDYLENVVGFDFSTLSTNSSGAILAINAFYAGAVDNAWAEGLWPHKWSLYPVFYADGVHSGAYQITNIGNDLSLRTFCHENGHMLFAWPDLYDYGYESNGVGNYCLMCYGGNNDNPVPPCAYLRYKAGWETIIDINSTASGIFYVTSNSFTTYRYSHPTYPEYFLIESRLREGRNTYIPDEGLVIWHIDEFGSNDYEQMTCSQHYEVSLEQADGLFQLENRTSYGGAGDLFHAGYMDNFGDNTIPNSGWWCSGVSGFEITEISAVGDIMNFTIGGCTSDPDCDDGVGCTVDSCDEVSGTCVHTASNILCDNGDYCDGIEACNPENGCQAGTPPDCDDGVGCTVDSCDEYTDTCVHTASNVLCDNGDSCDGIETCDSENGCQAGTPINCDDGVGCTVDSCDEDTGICDHMASNILCDNGDYCDGIETCNPEIGCQAGTPLDCDDGVGCTIDSCDEDADTCVHTASNILCDNGDYCDGIETCNPEIGCQTGTPPDCDDGVGCTIDSCDEDADTCVHTASNILCDNGDYCDGIETCNPEIGCQTGTPITCDDGTPCTIDTCNPDNGACVFSPFTCDTCFKGVCDGKCSIKDGIDCKDCAGSIIENSEVSCTDGLDNDCDGYTDGEDSDCLQCTVTEDPEVSCADGVDNDCDGDTDGDDSDCLQCTVTEDPEVSCADGVDNDCDGYTDGDDSDCLQCTVTEDPEVSCADGLDNDCDGDIDRNDSDCCKELGSPCVDYSECCSNKCLGKPGFKICK